MSIAFFPNPVFAADFSISESAVVDHDVTEAETESAQPEQLVFGWNFFMGKFEQIKQPWFNPEYLINIGDVINLRLWGAFEFAQDMPVDSQGNIFIPKVGNVTVLGVKNSNLIDVIRKKVRTVYKTKVSVYANVSNYQPITVFVTGNVNKPGIYQGMSSDSVLQFLDKAKGITPDYGSYRDIEIIRSNRVVKHVDLYSFLISGESELFQFLSGDVISVKDVLHRITVTGDVKRPYMFEFSEPKIKLREVLDLAILNPTATNVTITRWDRNNKKIIQTCSIDKSDSYFVHGGDSVDVYPDHTTDLFTLTISGEHDSLHTMLVKKNVSMGELLSRLTLNPRSDIESVQLFRKSVAAKQKQLLLANLQKLETLILTAPAVTKEESLMRTQESKLLLTFIDRAKKIEPKGQIVINEKTDPDEIFLEDEDRLFIPAKSNLVLVQGEVAFPGAHTFLTKLSAIDYIELSGDLTDRADKSNILVIHQNGRVIKCNSKRALRKIKISKGDSILVLPKLEGKNLQIAKDLTQIIYQIAVSAGVILAL